MMGITIRSPILLVEDNPNDVLITKKAWEKGKIKNELIVAGSGEEALKFLRERSPVPCLVLLDLKMPKMSGFQVLEAIKKDENLKKLPVIVLTSSENSEDINKAYDLGCNSYIIKPVNFMNFIATVIDIDRYWLAICQTPEIS